MDGLLLHRVRRRANRPRRHRLLLGAQATGTYHEPSVALRAEKEHFGSSRRARWFGRGHLRTNLVRKSKPTYCHQFPSHSPVAFRQ